MKFAQYLIPLMVLASACTSVDPSVDSEDMPAEVEAIGTQRSAVDFAPFDGCTESRERKLRYDERLIRFMTDADIIEWVTGNFNGKPHWIVDHFFDDDGVWDQETTNHVRSAFRQVRTRVDDVQVRCRDIWNCSGNDVYAYVGDGPVQRVTFCDSYFSAPPELRAAIWVHELSHELLETEDRTSELFDPLENNHVEGTRKLSYPNTKKFVDNGHHGAAKQYEAFMLNLIGEYWDSMYQIFGKGPITEREFKQAIIDIHYGFNPYERLFGTSEHCWEGDVREWDCPENLNGRRRSVCRHGEWEQTSVCAHPNLSKTQ